MLAHPLNILAVDSRGIDLIIAKLSNIHRAFSLLAEFTRESKQQYTQVQHRLSSLVGLCERLEASPLVDKVVEKPFFGEHVRSR
jgi:hypothetical protein